MKKTSISRPYREPVLPVYDTTSVTKRSFDTPEVSPEVPQPHTDKAEPGFSCYSAHNCLPRSFRVGIQVGTREYKISPLRF